MSGLVNYFYMPNDVTHVYGQHWQVDVVQQLVVELDGEAGVEENHHLLLAVLLQEREQQQEALLRRTHDVALATRRDAT